MRSDVAIEENSLRATRLYQRIGFRWFAVLIHLGASALLIAAVCMLALVFWFPYPLYELDGTKNALVTLAAVDLIIGPFITAIISSSKKSPRELFFDFTAVLCIQLAALSFGLMKIHDQRVAALVHVDKGFHLVPASRLSQPSRENPTSLPQFKGIPYGLLMQSDFAGMTRAEIELTMYNPALYHELLAYEVRRSMLPAEYIPKALLEKYGDNMVYKVVAGKQSNGVAVLDEDMRMIDLVLAEVPDQLVND